MINYKKADLNELDEIIRCRMEFIREDIGPQIPEMEATIQAQLKEYLANHLNCDCYVFAAVEDDRIISIAFFADSGKACESKISSWAYRKYYECLYGP